MRIYFDDYNDFDKDLSNLIAGLDRFNNPIVVVPTELDVTKAKKEYENVNVTIISYDYWLSKKWILDGEYDHIDFFRIDQFFINKSYGVKCGVGTMRRIKAKKDKEEETNVNE